MISTLYAIYKNPESNNGQKKYLTLTKEIDHKYPQSFYKKSPWFSDFFVTTLFEKESSANDDLATKTRIIRFIDCTELQPSNAWRSIFQTCGTPVGFDHTLVWYDRRSKTYIITTEPYCNEPSEYKNIEHWRRIGFDVTWSEKQNSIWNPPHTKLFMLTPSSNPAKINQLMSIIDSGILK